MDLSHLTYGQREVQGCQDGRLVWVFAGELSMRQAGIPGGNGLIIAFIEPVLVGGMDEYDTNSGAPGLAGNADWTKTDQQNTLAQNHRQFSERPWNPPSPSIT
jgi:hypothetical protein